MVCVYMCMFVYMCLCMEACSYARVYFLYQSKIYLYNKCSKLFYPSLHTFVVNFTIMYAVYEPIIGQC